MPKPADGGTGTLAPKASPQQDLRHLLTQFKNPLVHLDLLPFAKGRTVCFGFKSGISAVVQCAFFCKKGFQAVLGMALI